MDIAFGTFKASFNDHPSDKDGPKPREDTKSSLRLIPTQEFTTYLGASSLCVFAWAYPALQRWPVTVNQALTLASVAGFGPVVMASLISRFYSSGNITHPVKMSLIANLLHLFFGILFCSVPVTYACFLVLTQL